MNFKYETRAAAQVGMGRFVQYKGKTWTVSFRKNNGKLVALQRGKCLEIIAGNTRVNVLV